MDKLSYLMLYIGSPPAGLLGLEELFTELFNIEVEPRDNDIERLIKGVRKYNFNPKTVINDYLIVL